MLHTTPRRATALQLPKRLPEKTRAQVEDAIETLMAAEQALIDYLDRMDGDPDIEPNMPGNVFDDREGGDVQDEPHDPDGDEPSLAHTNDLDQERARRLLMPVQYRDGSWHEMTGDLEAEHDGREPDNDREERCDDDLPESRTEHHPECVTGAGMFNNDGDLSQNKPAEPDWRAGNFGRSTMAEETGDRHES